MIISEFWCRALPFVLAFVASAFIIWFFVRNKKGDFGCGCFFSFIIFTFVLIATSMCINEFSVSIISVKRGRVCEKFRILGSTNPKHLKVVSAFELKLGKTYIENLSGRTVKIEPVSYGPLWSSANLGRNGSDSQIIRTNSVAEFENIPDYYFVAPDLISVDSYSSFKNQTRWLLKYSGE